MITIARIIQIEFMNETQNVWSLTRRAQLVRPAQTGGLMPR